MHEILVGQKLRQEIHQWFPEYYISHGGLALASNCGQKTYSILSYSIGIRCMWAVRTDVIQLASNVWNWIDIKPFNWYHMSGIGLMSPFNWYCKSGIDWT